MTKDEETKVLSNYETKLKKLNSTISEYEAKLGVILQDIVKKTDENKVLVKTHEKLSKDVEVVSLRINQLISHENNLLQSFELRKKDLTIKEQKLEENRLFVQKMLDDREEEIKKSYARLEVREKFIENKDKELKSREEILSHNEREIKKEKELLKELSAKINQDRIECEVFEKKIASEDKKIEKAKKEHEAREYKISTAEKKLKSDIKTLEENKANLEDKEMGLNLREASLNKRERRVETIVETNRLKGS